MRDLEIIKNIRNGKRDKAIKVLYKEYPKIRANIISNGGDDVIAQEIFHDSLILIIEKVTDPNFELTSKLSTFLYGINHFLWKNELRRRKKSPEREWKDTLILTAEDLNYEAEKEEELKKLEHVLTHISARCKKIFELFYFQKESMANIASQLEFSSINSAKTQKYKCMEKAISIAKANQTIENHS